MALKFKENIKNEAVNVPSQSEINYSIMRIGIPNAPLGLPLGMPPVSKILPIRSMFRPPPMAMPGANLKRAIHYNADYGGCGFWRMSFPEMLLNINQKMIINSLTTMVTHPDFYLKAGWCAVKVQRQATPIQLEFVKLLKQLGKHEGFKIIYELDDIVFYDDIPPFNRCREAFAPAEIQKSIKEMMDMSDEFTVVSPYMAEYYKERTNNKKVTVIPNYSPKFWFGGKYNEEKLLKEYNKNKKKPRILMTPSGTHFDVLNTHGQKDDYEHVSAMIAKTRKDFQWVFIGSYPLSLRPFIVNGDIEYHEWVELINFPQKMYDTNTQVSMAALQNNHFNKSKSDIKFVESGYLGLPFIGQDMQPYKESFYKFNTDSEMIDHIKSIVKNEDVYMNACKKAYAYSDKLWLDDHLNEHIAIYTTPYGDPSRKTIAPYMIKNNPQQFLTV